MPLLNTAIIERPINPNNIIALFEKKRVGKRLVCAICKARLDYLEGTETIWICSNCSQTYDTSIQDAPIKDLNESKVKTYPELEKYPTFDERDVCLPFVEGIDPDADGDNISGNIEIVSDDGFRHKHIRVKGLPVEALSRISKTFWIHMYPK